MVASRLFVAIQKLLRPFSPCAFLESQYEFKGLVLFIWGPLLLYPVFESLPIRRKPRCSLLCSIPTRIAFPPHPRWLRLFGWAKIFWFGFPLDGELRAVRTPAFPEISSFFLAEFLTCPYNRTADSRPCTYHPSLLFAGKPLQDSWLSFFYLLLPLILVHMAPQPPLLLT